MTYLLGAALALIGPSRPGCRCWRCWVSRWLED